MDRKTITQKLSKALEKKINPNGDTRIYWAKEVTFQNYLGENGSTVRVDYMQFKPINLTVSGVEHGDVYAYEVKSCEDDFTSGHGLNFVGDYNYLVMTEELYEKIEEKLRFSKIGVLCPVDTGAEEWQLKSVNPAKRMDRIYPLSVVLLAMFRSANRDRKK